METDSNHAELVERAFQLLGRTITRIDPGRLEEWAGLGLTMTQIRLLFILRQYNGANARFLADWLKVAPPTFTRIMDRLVRSGLVQREVDREDRRQVLHLLSDKGSQTVAELERTGRARFQQILAHLSEEQLERLVAALEDLFGATEAAEAAEGAGVRG